VLKLRRRLLTYQAKHEGSDESSERLIQAAAHHVYNTLDFLDLAIEDYVEACTNYTREMEWWDANRSHREANERNRRACYLVQFRIETFYVFARVLLDDVAVLLHWALGSATGGEIGITHKGIAKNLPAIAAAEGLAGYEDVIARGDELAGLIKDFRDDYVVHQSGQAPRAIAPGFRTDPEDKTSRLSYGTNEPMGDDTWWATPLVESGDLVEVQAKLEKYVDAVVEFLDPLPVLNPTRTVHYGQLDEE
jgi:hypothetical protein